MLVAWDAAFTEAKDSALEKAEVSEANRFWMDNFGSTGDVQGVEVLSFVNLFCEKFSVSEGGRQKACPRGRRRWKRHFDSRRISRNVQQV
jgi:hypothetical protein